MDYVAQSLALLMSGYKSLVNVPGIVTALAQGDQALEDTLQDMLSKRNILTAVGAQLDGVGELVGQARGGMLDDQYRVVIFAKIAANNSNGTGEDLIAIYAALMQTTVVILTEVFPATVILQAENPVPIGALGDIKNAMNAVKAGGINLLLQEDMGPFFSFAEDPDPGTAGWGDSTDPSVGGIFSSLF